MEQDLKQTQNHDWPALARTIKAWGRALGFAQIGITDTDLSLAESHFQDWLAAGYHGSMDYMAAHGTKRTRPAELVPGTVRIITARLDYLPQEAAPDWLEHTWQRMQRSDQACISHYARGRDYHKVLRQRLQQLSEKIAGVVGPFGYRVFTDSAPVLEIELARKSGLGWRGKHTLMLNREAGSMFFLGEIFTDLPLPADAPTTMHCGTCQQCLEVCPTQAIIAPYKLDARRCISYLTIELKDSIPIELRPLIGNRVYGCDDCQLICPWNKYAQKAQVPDFSVRNGLDHASLVELFGWSEEEFNRRLEGSAIRRIGHAQWLRNLAVGLGNVAQTAAGAPEIMQALHQRVEHSSALVREHVAWAIQQHGIKTPSKI